MVLRKRAVRLAAVATAALIAAPTAEAAELALKRVLLSTGGVGLYEYEAQVDGDATVELKAPLDQIDDILKSLVVFDDNGGVGGLDLAGPSSLAETFRALPFTPKDLQSTPQLMAALRGAEVEVGGSRALKGRIVAVAEEREAKPDGSVLTTRHRVTLSTDAGLEQFVLEQADSIRFADAGLREAMNKALAAVAGDAERGSRVLRLSSKGQGPRALHVAYLAAAPVWKVSYRMVLDRGADAKTAALQGWATLENFSGQDWSDVDLTLVSGRPVSYRQELYRAYIVNRPLAPLDLGAQLNPGVDRGGMPLAQLRAPTPGAFKSMSRALPMPTAAEPPAMPALSSGADAVAAQEGETQVAFPLPHPVSVAAGRTLSLPIVDRETPAARTVIYDPQVDPRHPLSAVDLTNDGKSALPPGIVTIYERGESSVTYVGDSRLSATPSGEKRLLSYALDQKTTVAEDDSDNTSLARARIAKGVLTLDELTRRRIVYRVKADEPRKLVVFAPRLDGAALVEPKTPATTEADGRYRVTFDAQAGDGQNFAVTQERTETRFVELANLDDASLAVYVKSGQVDPETRAALQKLSTLRAAQAEAERAAEDAKAKAEAITADQARLKDLVGAVSTGSDLHKRYLSELDADETQLKTARDAIAAREAARDEARKAVQDFVAGM